MSQVWVVVASSTRCRIFIQKAHNAPLVEIEDMVHPVARLRPGQTRTDKPGRSLDGNGGGRHAVGRPPDARVQECQRFAKDVASRIESARQKHQFDRLVVIAEPKFLGRLRQGLSSATRSCVTAQLQKNLCMADPQVIREALPYRI
ncbi:MAG: host attachment protein [Gammaproteobacteria bacterium]